MRGGAAAKRGRTVRGHSIHAPPLSASTIGLWRLSVGRSLQPPWWVVPMVLRVDEPGVFDSWLVEVSGIDQTFREGGSLGTCQPGRSAGFPIEIGRAMVGQPRGAGLDETRLRPRELRCQDPAYLKVNPPGIYGKQPCGGS